MPAIAFADSLSQFHVLVCGARDWVLGGGGRNKNKYQKILTAGFEVEKGLLSCHFFKEKIQTSVKLTCPRAVIIL